MHDLLTNPAIQAGLIPFCTALLLGLLLKRMGWYWTGLALTAGFAATVYLVVGFQFQPWTGTRKLIALGLGAAGLGMLLDIYPWSRRWFSGLLFIIMGAAVLWVIWPVLQRRAGLDLWMAGIGSVVFGGWCAVALESLRSKPVQAVGAAVALGFGTGGVALLGASALLGELGLALGAAAGALWLLVTFTRKTDIGSLAMLPAGVLGGLIGIGGHLYAEVPWYSLALLALVPACGHVSIPTQWPHRLQALAALILAGAPAGIAVWLLWHVAGGVPL